MSLDENIRRIGWEKWIDPYGENAEEAEWPGAFGTFESDELLDKINNPPEENEWSEDEFEDTHQQQLPILPVKKKPKALATPMGFIPLAEWSTPSKVFNFWVAHTNFRMTDEIQDLLDSAPGVETLDIFTPYRWRISIGKAFNGREVKDNIQKLLDAEIADLD